MGFRERYAECRRYADTGIVTHASGKRFCRFETRFDRGRDSFWFRMWLPGGRVYAIDAEGPRVEVTSPDRAPEMVCDALVGKPRALLLAIAGLTGISACAAYVIPHLLLPEMLDHELARNKRLADPIDESCYELDAATGLIVRFLERKTEIAYAPQLDD